jgi:hypothetical protein
MKKNNRNPRTSFFAIFPVLAFCFWSNQSLGQQTAEPYVLSEFSLGTEIGKLRAAPIRYAPGKQGFLIAYSESEEVDPFVEMFFFPKHTMKLVLIDQSGEEVWRKDLGKGVMPGIWFCPVFPFDLDKDGVDEIWFVNNPDEDHPLAYSQYRLERWHAADGNSSGHWKWPSHNNDSRLSHLFRNFVFGGYVDGEPVLITAQGTYKDMKLQAWNPGMEQRWELFIKASDPGARGSHMSPVVDINADGKDELMWGERCISLDDGKTLFVAAEDSWQGHSDIIQPLYHEASDSWYTFTCREDGGWDDHAPPRVVMFDQQGQEVWRKLDRGHMDMGWTARLKGYDEPVAFTVRIGNKKAGPDGFYRAGVEEFAYLAFSGKEISLPFQAYNTVPVDFDGDGVHELVGGLGHQGTKDILRGNGEKVGNIGEKGTVAMAAKLLDHPGEQIFVYYPDGTIRIWADKNAKDSEKALERYRHPFYQRNRALTATGYNLVNLGGL